MKLPYRAGDSFALPLGDGSHAAAQIVGCGRYVADIVAFDRDGAPLPALRASDRALVLQRWRRTGHAPIVDAPPPRRGSWTGPAKIERQIAARLGARALELPALRIHEGRFNPEYPCVRDAASLAAMTERNVRTLVVVGNIDLRDLPHRFPELRHLRIAVRGMRVDARMLARLAALEVLDCSGITIERLDALAACARLRVLRLARIGESVDLDALVGVPAHALSLEAIVDLRHPAALLERPGLRQLELLGQWQIDLSDVMPLADLPQLVRAEIDVGGRRKNVELYRRANWAYPWPIDLSLTQ